MLTETSTLNDILGESSEPREEETQVDTSKETEAEETKEPESSEETLNTEEEETKEAKGKDKDDESRFDKHPRWQERQRQLDEERAKSIRLEAELSVYKTMAAEKQGEQKQAPSPTYKDITAMSDEELAEQIASDPKGFAANLYSQLKEELTRDVGGKLKDETAKERQERVLKEEYERYEEKNPDFRKLWDTGEIKKYMDAHPGRTPMSAHMEMTYESKLAEAKKEAAAEKEKELAANRSAKKKAGTLGAGPAAPVKGTHIDPRLQDSKAHGGLTAVLAQRLEARRSTA
jgi:hypothetical protein